jgi:hypothetical protein
MLGVATVRRKFLVRGSGRMTVGYLGRLWGKGALQSRCYR